MIAQDVAALRSHFADNWTQTVAFYDNAPLADLATDLEYAFFAVRLGASSHDAGGASAGLKRQLGRLWLKISVPKSTGDGRILALADAFATLFRNAHFDDGQIVCHTEQFGAPEIVDGRFVMTVSIPWASLRRYA